MIMNPFLQRNRCRANGGFTLLELMTALTITSMLVVMLFAAFDQASRAWTAAENRTETFQVGRAILDLMARDLAQACPNAPTNFTAGFTVNLTTNSFSTTIGTNGAVSDLCDVSYVFDSTTHSLTRSTMPWTSPFSFWSAPTDLADTGTVLNCSFVYYTNAFTTGFTNTYDSTAPSFGGRPPAAVQIWLDLLDAKTAGTYTNLPVGSAAAANVASKNVRHFSTIVYIPGGVR
jgi:prepilin-type N-terminal cleavage/methylation domain-containing protein